MHILHQCFLKIHGDAAARSLSLRQTHTQGAGSFLNITNSFTLHGCAYEQPAAPALCLVSSGLCSVGSVHQQSSHSWIAGWGILTSRSPPSERRSAPIAASPDLALPPQWLSRASVRVEDRRGGGETAGILLLTVGQ